MKREHSPGEGIAEPTREEYSSLVDSIGLLLEQGRQEAFQAVNFILVRTYWSIGRRIVDFEQGGKEKSEYGSALLGKLSGDLKFRYGKGFSRSNLYLMRELYIKYPKIQTLSGKLSWSHYSELLSVEDDMARHFYEIQTDRERWSVRELRRQIDSSLFQRIALSKDKIGVLEM